LPGKEGNIEPPVLFVKGSDQPVDQSMFFGNCAVGKVLTVLTTTGMNNGTNRFCHKTPPAINNTMARLL
jgi:hypothetical protein